MTPTRIPAPAGIQSQATQRHVRDPEPPARGYGNAYRSRVAANVTFE